MSKTTEDKKPLAQDAALSSAKLTLTVTLSPAISSRELIEFHDRATAAGETPEERLARLIRQDTAPVAA